jgi:hypothetical protein
MTDYLPAPRKVKKGYDWPAIKTEYITSTIHLRDLANKHGVHPSVLMKRAAKEGWEAERKQRQADIALEAQRILREEQLNELVEFNRSDVTLAKALRAQIAKRINAAKDLANPLPLAGREIRQLSAALVDTQKVGRLALGILVEPEGMPFAHPMNTINPTAEQLASEQDCLNAAMAWALKNI